MAHPETQEAPVRSIALAVTTCALLLAAGLGGIADPVAAQAPKPAEPTAPADKPGPNPPSPRKDPSP